jgi:uncharacterized protein YjbJ (UPF0337 family)
MKALETDASYMILPDEKQGNRPVIAAKIKDQSTDAVHITRLVRNHAADAPLVKIEILKEDSMKSSIRDKTEGRFHELKGKVREMAGKITDNPKLRAKGKAEKIAGNVQEKIGQIKKVLGK